MIGHAQLYPCVGWVRVAAAKGELARIERPRIVRTSATTEVRPTLGLCLQESGGAAGAGRNDQGIRFNLNHNIKVL